MVINTCEALVNIGLSTDGEPDVLEQNMLPFTFRYEPFFIYTAGKSSKSDIIVALSLQKGKSLLLFIH